MIKMENLNMKDETDAIYILIILIFSNNMY